MIKDISQNCMRSERRETRDGREGHRGRMVERGQNWKGDENLYTEDTETSANKSLGGSGWGSHMLQIRQRDGILDRRI